MSGASSPPRDSAWSDGRQAERGCDGRRAVIRITPPRRESTKRIVARFEYSDHSTERIVLDDEPVKGPSSIDVQRPLILHIELARDGRP